MVQENLDYLAEVSVIRVIQPTEEQIKNFEILLKKVQLNLNAS